MAKVLYKSKRIEKLQNWLDEFCTLRIGINIRVRYHDTRSSGTGSNKSSLFVSLINCSGSRESYYLKKIKVDSFVRCFEVIENFCHERICDITLYLIDVNIEQLYSLRVHRLFILGSQPLSSEIKFQSNSIYIDDFAKSSALMKNKTCKRFWFQALMIRHANEGWPLFFGNCSKCKHNQSFFDHQLTNGLIEVLPEIPTNILLTPLMKFAICIFFGLSSDQSIFSHFLKRDLYDPRLLILIQQFFMMTTPILSFGECGNECSRHQSSPRRE